MEFKNSGKGSLNNQIFIWDWDLNLGRKELGIEPSCVRSLCQGADGTIKTLVLTTETNGATLRNKMFWPFADFGSEIVISMTALSPMMTNGVTLFFYNYEHPKKGLPILLSRLVTDS